MQYSEKEMVEGCIRNERVWQETLYRRFFPTMIQMCMRYTNDRETAMEIVNAGFLRVFKKLHTFTFSGSLEGWIRRIVYHSVSDHFKSRTAQKVYFLDIADHDAPVQESALNRLHIEDVLKLVEKLPLATRDVFMLYAIEGLSHAEIAERVNISEGTSKWHLATARKKLKQWINMDFNQSNYAG